MKGKIERLREMFFERGELTIKDIQAEFGFKTIRGTALFVDSAGNFMPIYESGRNPMRFALFEFGRRKKINDYLRK